MFNKFKTIGVLCLLFIFVKVDLISKSVNMIWHKNDTNGQSWFIQTDGYTQEELQKNYFIIGSDNYQLNFRLSDIVGKEIHFSNTLSSFDKKNVIVLNFYFPQNERFFAVIDSDNWYNMYQSLRILPERKYKLVANASIHEQDNFNLMFFGNRNYEKQAQELKYINIWVAVSASSAFLVSDDFYLQTMYDLLAINTSIKTTTNINEYITYSGNFVLSPFLTNKELDLKSSENEKLLENLKINLSIAIIRQNHGVGDYLSVLLANKKLLDFYAQHTNNDTLRQVIIKRLDQTNLDIKNFEQLFYETGR